MARLKNSLSGWRRASMAHNVSPDVVTRQAADYLAWLCLARGWYSHDAPCTSCKGSGQRTSFESIGRHRRGGSRYGYAHRDCHSCSGTGRAQSAERVYDTGRATAYVAEQREDLERLAQAGGDGIKHRLFWHGFRPVVTGCRLPVNSLADYDRRERICALMGAEIERAEAEAAELHAEHNAAYFAASAEDQCAMLNDPAEPACRTADRRCNELRHHLRALGNVYGENLWSIPGTAETIHVGTSTARRGYGYVKPAHAIVIEPGRSPSGYELDMIAEEALAAIAGPAELQLAA